MTEKITLKNLWKAVPGPLNKFFMLKTERGPINGVFVAVPGVGVDFKGDRNFDPLEKVTKLAFQRQLVTAA